MTVLGKCDTCRARKVKCDQKRPICSSCSAKSRVCCYSYTPDTSDFVYEHGQSVCTDLYRGEGRKSFQQGSISSTSESGTTLSRAGSQISSLRLQCIESLGAASGLYITFKHDTKSHRKSSVRKATHEPAPYRDSAFKPSAGLVCPATAQHSRYGSIFGLEGLKLNPLGQWLQHAWYRVAEEACIQDALDYTHEAMIGFRRRDTAVQESRIFVAAQRALRSLQSAINAMNESAEMRDDLIVAIMLHYAAEHFTSLGTFNYVPHLKGVVQLLKAKSEDTRNQKMRRNVLTMICVDEVVECLFRARSSAFADMPRPDLPNLQSHDLGIAHEAAAWLIVQTPGLVSDVRALTVSSSPSAVEHLFGRARQLWTSEADAYVRSVLDGFTSILVQPVDTMISPTERVLAFRDQAAFVLATRYYFYRIILSGLLQTLHCIAKSGLGGGLLNLEATPTLQEAEDEDVAAATRISMCLHYASGSERSAMPLIALAMAIPMEFSVGTWNRLRRRQETSDTADYHRAMYMKTWNLDRLHGICDLWRTFRTDYGRMTRLCDAFAGGPIYEGACAVRDRSLQEAKQMLEHSLPAQAPDAL